MAAFGRLVIALALGSGVPLGPSQAGAPLDAAEKRLEAVGKLVEAYREGDCRTVVRKGGPMLDAGTGAGLPAEVETLIYDIVVACEWAQHAHAKAHAHALKGTALGGGSDVLWRMRLGLELYLKQPEAAIATIEAMSGGRGAALNAIDVNDMWQLVRELKDLGKADLRKRLLALLAAEGYAPDDTFGSNEDFRYKYAELLAESGDAAAARPIIAGLHNVSNLAQASLDTRFRDFLPKEIDFRAAAEAELTRDREQMAIHPDRLDAVVAVAGDLRRLGRPQEALDVLLAAGPGLAEAGAFKDLEETVSWYWDALGRAYNMLGRYDAMVESFRKGSAGTENGVPNVSQVLNLAGAQLEFRRGDEALGTLAVFADGRKSSPYGEMVMRYARGCAYALADRPTEAAADLAFAREHEKDNPGALSGLLLCMGDLDGAAAAFIRRLDDPTQRAAALLQLSEYDEPVAARPPDPVDSRLPELKARTDIQAAILRAGGVRRFKLQRGEI
jgi:tetratricopeptide (TPR) repeat protein